MFRAKNTYRTFFDADPGSEIFLILDGKTRIRDPVETSRIRNAGVVDPYYFGTDLDPRIPNTAFRIRILLFSGLEIRDIPNKGRGVVVGSPFTCCLQCWGSVADPGSGSRMGENNSDPG